MKKDNRLTELYLLPLNLCFLSFFGTFLCYELDKWLMSDFALYTSPLTLSLSALSMVLTAVSLKIRNPYFHAACTLWASVTLFFLF